MMALGTNQPQTSSSLMAFSEEIIKQVILFKCFLTCLKYYKIII